MHRTLLFGAVIAVLLAASPARGEMPLMTIAHNQRQNQLWDIEFQIFPSSTDAIWQTHFTPDDVGQTFTAPASHIAAWNQALRDDDAMVFFYDTIPNIIRHIRVDALGPGLMGNTLTRVTMTPTRLESIQSGSTVDFYTDATFRLYGVPVPEPAAIALLVLAHVSTLGWRVPRYRPYRSE